MLLLLHEHVVLQLLIILLLLVYSLQFPLAVLLLEVDLLLPRVLSVHHLFFLLHFSQAKHAFLLDNLGSLQFLTLKLMLSHIVVAQFISPSVLLNFLGLIDLSHLSLLIKLVLIHMRQMALMSEFNTLGPSIPKIVHLFLAIDI